MKSLNLYRVVIKASDCYGNAIPSRDHLVCAETYALSPDDAIQRITNRFHSEGFHRNNGERLPYYFIHSARKVDALLSSRHKNYYEIYIPPYGFWNGKTYATPGTD